MDMYNIALQYKALGFSILGCANKKPVMGSWLAYKSEIASDEDLKTMFIDRKASQVSIICGTVSGNLEIIDVDIKHDITGTLFDDLWARIVDYFKGQPPQFLLQSTPSGGFHIVYRCTEPVKGNLKLASRRDEKHDNQVVTMIETRGEGGYFIATPSPKYTAMMGVITSLPVLDKETVLDLHDICRQFNKVTQKHRDKPKSKVLYSFKRTPWDDYNSHPEHPALTLLQLHGWNITKSEPEKTFLRRPGAEHENHWGAIYHHDTHVFYVFTSSSTFEPEKGYSPTAVLSYLEHDGDFAAACSALRREGFGQTFTDTEKRAMTRASTLYEEGLSFNDIVKMLSTEYREISESLDVVVSTAEKKQNVKKGIFWEREKKGTLRTVKPRLADFLQLQGFRLYGNTIDDDKKKLVHIDVPSHIIREMPIDVLKKQLQNWIYDTDFSEFEVTDNEIRELLFDLTKSAWSDVFEWLEVLTVDTCPILRDTRYTAYIPFQNCIIKIDKKKIVPLEYDELPAGTLIWESSIKKRNIFLAPIENDLDLNNSATYLFIKRIAGVSPTLDGIHIEDLIATYPKTAYAFQSFITATGYLLTNYKDPENPLSVTLAENTASEGEGGGTGKGLYMKMIGTVRNVCFLPGRQWKPEKDFLYQRVTPATDILFIDDVPPRFDFKDLYNIITEGMPIDRKHKEEIMVPYSHSPKVVISTNYDVVAEGDHGKRRQVKIFFEKYFTATHKPAKEFGKQFFSEQWNDEDWNWHYNAMFFMIQAYYTWGLIQVDTTENMKLKQIKLRFTEHFYDFMHKIIFVPSTTDDPDITKTFVSYEYFYDNFLSCSGLEQSEYKKRRFTMALKFFCEQFKIEYTDRQITHGHEKGKKEIKLTLPEWLTKELLEKAREETDRHGDIPF